MLELNQTNAPQKLDTYLPKKDFILLTGTIEVLGMQLFCGSVVYDNEDGLSFSPCKVLTPDPILYNNLKEKEVGDVMQITKKRVKGSSHLKNDFEVIDVVKTEELQKDIDNQLSQFDGDFYKDKNIII